jgi:hypothetical protein
VVAVNAQLLRRLDLRPGPIVSSETEARELIGL